LKNLLDKAIQIAVNAHSGQTSDNGEPYILHPMRMMLQFDIEEERIVAILHDTIEKTHVDYGFLKDAGFCEEVLFAVDSLTRKPDENYDNYIHRVSKNKLATKIKVIDLLDNISSLRREPKKMNASNYLKYQKALEYLK
tara:strand:- start:260 stop:676 length:417 start_codon:yes stop_codon:yes gene_type:complete